MKAKSSRRTIRRVERFALFDTKADSGISIWGETRSALFRHAVMGLNHLMFGPSRRLAYTVLQSQPCKIAGHDPESLLVNLLSEIVFLQEERDIEVTDLSEIRLERGLLTGALFFIAPGRRCLRVVKSITYHQLKVQKTPRGWHARLVVDL